MASTVTDSQWVRGWAAIGAAIGVGDRGARLRAATDERLGLVVQRDPNGRQVRAWARLLRLYDDGASLAELKRAAKGLKAYRGVKS